MNRQQSLYNGILGIKAGCQSLEERQLRAIGFLASATSTGIYEERNSDLGKMIRLRTQESTREGLEHRLELDYQ